MEDARLGIQEFGEKSAASLRIKMDNFPVYASRQQIARFTALSKLFEMQLNVKGSIVECGVFQGGGLFTYAHLSAIHEPSNYHRQVIGFDTFDGFPEWTTSDEIGVSKVGDFAPKYGVFGEMCG